MGDAKNSERFAERNDFGMRSGSSSEACLVCEAMCPDAVDGTLSEAERKAFDKHVAGCAPCAQELEDAQRGAAWLGLLKAQTPEPPAALLDRILAETTGAAGSHSSVPVRAAAPPPAPAPALTPSSPDLGRTMPVALPSFGRLLAFRRPSSANAFTREGSGLHPRLAMTAAMAFFSVALTLNLTGVRLGDLRAENLQPAALQRYAGAVEASAMRSFQNIRVVYELESRVSELRQGPRWDDPSAAARIQASPYAAGQHRKRANANSTGGAQD